MTTSPTHTASASADTIVLENVGPIPFQQIHIRPAGITRLVAPNGSGKSLALEAVQTALRGKGKVPLRDQTKRGKVDACGATITIGGACRHTGQCEFSHLEGRLDIGALIDPRLKSPESADAARIKALVHLTGVEADPALFLAHSAFEDWDNIVDPDSVKTDDLVEMARRIKADYDAAARLAEAEAERELGHANGMATPEAIDLQGPCDEQALSEAYDSARDDLTSLERQRDQYAQAQTAAIEARQTLSDLDADELAAEFIGVQWESAIDECNAIDSEISDLEAQLQDLRSRKIAAENRANVLREQMTAAKNRETAVAMFRKVIMEFEQLSPVSEEALQAAQSRVDQARTRCNIGAVIRQARQTAAQANVHRRLAVEARDRAARLRDAGRATDDVLSSAIQSDLLRIESDGKSTRLVTATSRGQSTPYHDLSAGERGAIAIDIAAAHVGERGLLVISQEVFEGLDYANRMRIEAKAIERNVRILTAEASQHPDAEFAVLGVD